MRSAAGEGAEDGADGAGVEADEFEGEGDEFVRALGDAAEDEAFEDGDFVFEDGVVSFEFFIGEEIDAGGVDADEHDALACEGVDEVWREGGEIVVPLGVVGEGAGADEDALFADLVDAAVEV